ncbi:ATP-dependent DNA ligase [Streptomyces sp. NPDC003710]
MVYAHGRIDFAAAQSRALSTPAGARRLADDLPAHFVAWDVLLHPEHGDVRARRYDDRRALLVDLLQEYDVKPPIQLVPMTDDPTVAMTWYQQLPEQGIEGIVAKRATSAYKAGRIWSVDCTNSLTGSTRRASVKAIRECRCCMRSPVARGGEHAMRHGQAERGQGGRVSAGARMPLHVDIKFVWRHPEGRFSNYPPRTGNGERVMVAKVAFRKGHGALGDQLASHADQEGLQASVEDRSYAVGPDVDYSTLLGATVTILGAAGGIGGVAAVLKVFFERNNGKKVTFGQDGEVLDVEGLSADEIVRLLETLRDQRVEEENARSSAQQERVSGVVAEQAISPSMPRRSRLQRLLARRRSR